MTDAATGERLIAADDLAGFAALAPAETVHNVDRYLDTPDGDLAAAGYAGRLRTSETGTVITLKGLRRLDDGGATHRREELEGPADPATGASAWPASAAREAVLAIAGDTPLDDLVTIRQVRRKRMYGRDGAVVELSVDDVEIVADDRVIERFAELELELRAGGEEALEPLADLLGGDRGARAGGDVEAGPGPRGPAARCIACRTRCGGRRRGRGRDRGCRCADAG